MIGTMSKFKRATARTVVAILDTFSAQVQMMSEEDRKYVAQAVNDMLNELMTDDFFGTEGQLDPRGDPR